MSASSIIDDSVEQERSLHFLELDAQSVHNPDSSYAVLPIPYERTVSFGKGTGAAPEAIIRVSEQMEMFDEELLKAPCLRVQTLAPIDCNTGTETEVLRRIEQTAFSVMKNKRFLMSFGGEHTVSVPLITAAKSVYGDLSVLHLDAHADLRETYEGTPWSHACAMRRIYDMAVPVVHAGIRSLSEEEYRLIHDRSGKLFWADVMRHVPEAHWITEIVHALKARVYITVDSDVFDPCLIPGTGTPEPGGLGWYPMIHLLRRVCESRQVIGADIVELAPMPGTAVNEFTAARLAFKIMSYHCLLSGTSEG